MTYVAVEEAEVLGFATVAPAHIEIDDLPEHARKKLPRYPLPVLRLARLAVDRSTRGGGVGRHLLRFVFQLAMRMSEEYGCVGVVVDAKRNAVAFYEKYGFIHVEIAEGTSEPMFLSISAIRDAIAN